MANVEKDEFTGTNTTGHEWDGIKELDTPMPRWWLWTFYACIAWAVGYWVVYPSWPMLSDHWKGTSQQTNRKDLVKELAARDAERALERQASHQRTGATGPLQRHERHRVQERRQLLPH